MRHLEAVKKRFSRSALNRAVSVARDWHRQGSLIPGPRLVASMLAVLMTLATAVRADELDQASELIKAGENEQAFRLLEPLEFDRSGEENYDLLFGYAALESGHVSLATLALERVLAVNPDNNTARFHLARAFFTLSDFDGARREFELLLSMNPTSGMRETVGQYLDAIAARRPGAKTRIAGYLSLGIGTDTNVNGATSTNPIYFPLIGDSVRFDRADIRDGDNVRTAGGGLTVIHPFNEQTSVYGSADLLYQQHADRSDLDYGFLSAGAGLQHAIGNHSLRLGLRGGHMVLDDQNYQHHAGIDLEWRRTLAERTQFGLVGAFTRYTHARDIDKVQDYDDSRLTASLLRVTGAQGRNLVSGALEAGHEQDRRGRDDGAMNYYGLRLTGQVGIGDDHNGFMTLSWKDKRYRQDNFLFSKRRHETLFQAVAGLNIGLAKTFSLRPSVSYTDQESNIPLYSYDRTALSLVLRKDFL